MIDSPCYFGIDGGGTRSRLKVVDEAGNTLLETTGESTSIYSMSPEVVTRNLKNLLEPLSRFPIRSGCMGSAGLSRENEKTFFRNLFSTLLPTAPVHLCSDGEILLIGGLLSMEGYCLISGTGSLALRRDADGHITRSGGFGYMLGDEGSAWWIAHQALMRALRSREKRDVNTSMLPSLLNALSLKDIDELITYMHHRVHKAEVAHLAPVVTAFAEEGDPLARKILTQAAEELFSLIDSIYSTQMGQQELVLAGGVLEHDALVSEALARLLSERLPALSITQARGTALDGACLRARMDPDSLSL
ncbi:MAG: hypothetical protein JXK93_00860 [Sphaerochaetaceae bacterium]|nr:hypothetical protein [Sphaerochaetaceae bacterium]